MTSYKLTDLNSDILNKIYEEITNRNKGEIREIVVFEGMYKKFMEENGFNPKHFRIFPYNDDIGYYNEITTTYQMCLDDPDCTDAEHVACTIEEWIMKYAYELLSCDEKNNIICWYGIKEAFDLFYDWNRIVLKNNNNAICAYMQKENIDSSMVFQILKEVVEFNPSSEWRND